MLDMDSSEAPTYGDQEGSAYNGHFGNPGGSRPRSNGIRASCTRVSGLSLHLIRPAERLVAFYNQRGTAEQWIKEGRARDQVDQSVMPHLRRQHGPSSAPCARL